MKFILHNVHLRLLALLIAGFSMAACSQQQEQEAGGEDESIFSVKKEKPEYYKIDHVDLGDGGINAQMATAGQEIFDMKCTACHKYDERYVGPPLGHVADKRTPEYIMNMILDTETMIENDDTVKCLMQEFLMRMPNQSLDEKDARNVLEHLRNHAKNN